MRLHALQRFDEVFDRIAQYPDGAQKLIQQARPTPALNVRFVMQRIVHQIAKLPPILAQPRSEIRATIPTGFCYIFSMIKPLKDVLQAAETWPVKAQ